MKFPKELKYSKDHEWIRVEGEIAVIGITAFAQHELGDIVYVDVDTLGEDLDVDAIFGSVEAVKTVSDLFMPVSGTVFEKNDKLEDSPQLINESPYEEGWLIKIKDANLDQLNDLLSAEAYKKEIGL